MVNYLHNLYDYIIKHTYHTTEKYGKVLIVKFHLKLYNMIRINFVKNYRRVFTLEKRQSKRLDVHIELKISDLFHQDNVQIKDIDAPIVVTNISKKGIGLETTATLPIGYYFNATINLGNSDSSLYTVLQIIRKEEHDNINYYGCEFVGLAPILDFIFEDYKPDWESEE